ncbi:transposase family protein [Streptomyces sp. V4I8]|uniref:transposase family protein n=1 Tax=Streptomyces sp. V4I8 TaxID=3156469 RepID=UPI003512B56A
MGLSPALHRVCPQLILDTPSLPLPAVRCRATWAQAGPGRVILSSRQGGRAGRKASALYKAAADGLPTLADSGYQGAGIGIHHPFKKPRGGSHLQLHFDTRTYNALLRGARALGERAAAELKERWRTLKRITLSPNRIGAITKAALVLNNTWR